MDVVKEYGGFGGFTIQQIEIFLTVAKHLNYSKAAKELYLSQPAISGWVSKLEDTLGVKVFNRLNRGVELTPEGVELYTMLEHVYQRFRVSVNVIIREMLLTSKFDIGGLSPDTLEMMREPINRFRSEHGDVDVYSEMFNYHELRDKLICGELDLIVTMYYDVKNQKDISAKVIGSLPQFFFFPKTWEYGAANLASLLGGKTMILEIHNGKRYALDICRAYGFEPSAVKHVNSYLEISKKIGNGNCFTIGALDLARSSHFNQNLSFLPIEGFDEPVAVAWYNGNDNPWLKQFLEYL